jgi:hypothetical protein
MALKLDSGEWSISRCEGLSRGIHELQKTLASVPYVSYGRDHVYLLTLGASSRAITRPVLIICSRKMLRQILKRAQALSGVTHGHDRSMIVRQPD